MVLDVAAAVAPVLIRELKVEEVPARAMGALAALVGAGVLVAIKWLVEWGRPEVKIATGAVDLGIGGWLTYEQFIAGKAPADPFMDTAKSAFGILELLVGSAAVISGIAGLTGHEELKIDEKIRSAIISMLP